MHIDRVTLYHVSMPLLSPFETSFGIERDRECILVRVESNGAIGWGECVAGGGPWYSYETSGTAWHILSDFLIPMMLEADLTHPHEVFDHLAPVRGHPMAKAGLEMAIWDLAAKQASVSLAELLGSTRDRVAVGVSIGIQPTVDDLLKRINEYIDQGYGRIKIKIKPGWDVDVVRAVRQQFPDIKLQVDANSAYTLSDIRVFRAIDALNLLLIEQPLAHDDIYKHAQLQRELKTPICLDESIRSVDDARAALELGSCRIINIKPGRVGGHTPSIRIHDLCRSHGVPVWHGGMLETGVGRAHNVALASLPGFTLPADLSASDRYYHQDLIESPFVLNPDSTLSVPTGPGIGVTVNGDRLRVVTLRKASFPR